MTDMNDLSSKTGFAQKIVNLQKAAKEREQAAKDEEMQEGIRREKNNK